MTNPDTPRQDPPESDYTHTFVDALYRWSDSDAGFLHPDTHSPISLPAALENASVDAGLNSFAAKELHWTHPVSLAPFTEPQVVYHYGIQVSVAGAHASWSTRNSSGGPTAASRISIPMADLGKSFSLTAAIPKVQVTDQPETKSVTGSYKVEFKLRTTSSSR